MTNSTDSATGTPDERLADKIVAEFESEQLIPAAKHIEVVTKLANGTVAESDWKLWLAPPLTKEEAGR
jgi:hypothetical protein